MQNRMRLRAAVPMMVAIGLVAGCTAGTHSSDTTKANASVSTNSPNSSATSTSASGKQLTSLTPVGTSDVSKVTWNVDAGEPASVDPFQSNGDAANQIVANMCESLLVAGPDFTIKPNLAESFSNPDPLHWVYKIRSGVKFWDGATMTAQDVAWSLNHNLTGKTSSYNYLYNNVKSIAATGADEVTVTMSKPDYLFNEEMADFAGVVVEQKYYEQHATTVGTPSGGLMCTGPFKFVSWAKGQSITLDRNADYWNAELMPKVHTIDFTFLTSDASIIAGMTTGEIDGAYDVPTTGFKQLESSSAGKLYFGPAQLNSAVLYTNAPGNPMNNLKLRQALQMAVDWNGIAKTVYQGAAVPMKGPMPPSVFGFAKSALQPAYDALPPVQSANYTAAKKLVAEAGPDASKTIVMATPSSPASYLNFGLAIEDAAKRIGLKFKLDAVSIAQFTALDSDARAKQGIDMLFGRFWPETPSPMDWIASTAVSTGTFNMNPDYKGVDALFAKAQSTADDGARAKLLVQIQAKLAADLTPMAPGVAVDNSLWMNKRISGAPASFDWVFYPWAARIGGTS